MTMDLAAHLASLATDVVFADLADPAQVADFIARLAEVTGPSADLAAQGVALLTRVPAPDPAVLQQELCNILDALTSAAAMDGLAPSAILSDDPARSEFLGRAPDALADLAHLVDQLDGGDSVVPDLRRAIHTLKGESGALDLRDLARVLHAAEDALAGPGAGPALAVPVRTALDWAAQHLDDLVHGTHDAGPAADCIATLTQPAPLAPLGEVLVGTGRIARADLEAALSAQALEPDRRLGQILIDAGKLAPEELSEALHSQRPLEPRPQVAAASVRVDVVRVDSLYDAVGELVIAQSMLAGSEDVRRLASRQVRSLLALVERTTAQIQDLAFRLRLVPVKALLQRAARVARETARATGKQVEVVLVGEDQELDRAVVDRLGEPLVHLVRNAIDHGLEDPAARQAAGKSPVGRLTLAAVARGGTFRIDVTDDGHGLDRDRILAKARHQGLIADDADLADEEIWGLIFRAGFSTAATVTDVSGRGVGLDAVRSAVDHLRGQVRITTVAGQGTTFGIHLPPTLAIIDGLAVLAAGRRYVLPTVSVISTTRLVEADTTTVTARGRLVGFQGRQVPLVSLAEVFQHPGDPVARPLIVILEDGYRRLALAVDAVLGRQQIVLKEVGAGLPPLCGIGGATIAADGRPCLVIDVPALLTMALGEELPHRRAV